MFLFLLVGNWEGAKNGLPGGPRGLGWKTLLCALCFEARIRVTEQADRSANLESPCCAAECQVTVGWVPSSI